MAGKELVKSKFDKDFDDAINSVMQAMTMVVTLMIVLPFIIPRLPVTQAAQQYFQNQQYEGQQDSHTLSATSVSQHIVLPNPWVGAFFINDGPSTVEIRMNDENADPYIINPEESRTISRIGAEIRIYAIYYKCYLGGIATVRVDGVY